MMKFKFREAECKMSNAKKSRDADKDEWQHSSHRRGMFLIFLFLGGGGRREQDGRRAVFSA
jgi:hypothetical protein